MNVIEFTMSSWIILIPSYISNDTTNLFLLLSKPSLQQYKGALLLPLSPICAWIITRPINEYLMAVNFRSNYTQHIHITHSYKMNLVSLHHFHIRLNINITFKHTLLPWLNLSKITDQLELSILNTKCLCNCRWFTSRVKTNWFTLH